ncbi:hypothetical protein D3C87_1371260 [compost metagenome]
MPGSSLARNPELSTKCLQLLLNPHLACGKHQYRCKHPPPHHEDGLQGSRLSQGFFDLSDFVCLQRSKQEPSELESQDPVLFAIEPFYKRLKTFDKDQYFYSEWLELKDPRNPMSFDGLRT